GQANRPGFDQAAANVGRLVALGVRTPGHARLPAESRSFRDIGLEPVEVDEQCGRVELFLGRSQWNKHKRPVRVARTNRVGGGCCWKQRLRKRSDAERGWKRRSQPSRLS